MNRVRTFKVHITCPNKVLDNYFLKHFHWNFDIDFYMQLLCILTRFWVLPTPESWSYTFFGHFKPFLFIFNVFCEMEMSLVSRIVLKILKFLKLSWTVKISTFIYRVLYFSYFTKKTFKSHTTNMATFVILRHHVTILVTDPTNTDNFILRFW